MNDHALADRLAEIQAGVADAAREAARDPRSITTVVVTKFHPATLVRQLFELGVRDFGENRHQEAVAKAAELTDLAELGLRWHFVGQLQSKKARQARAYASVVHSLDRDSVIAALAGGYAGASSPGEPDFEPRMQAPLDVFVQLNLTDDPGRGGVRLNDLEAIVQRVLETPALALLGVMAVAPTGSSARAAFEQVRLSSERVRLLAPGARFISTGMSGDYREAILEGATHLRIGAAITGNRPDAG